MNIIYKEDLEEVKKRYPLASDFELKILHLRELKYTYSAIQLALGNPSKKLIREILLKYAPELIDIKSY